MNLNFAGPILILMFLLITYLFSAFEKVVGWQTSLSYYQELFKDFAIRKIMAVFLIAIIIVEVIISVYSIFGIYHLVIDQDITHASLAFLIASSLCLVLLIGQRLIKDYAGAARIAIYFIVSSIGLFWLQSI